MLGQDSTFSAMRMFGGWCLYFHDSMELINFLYNSLDILSVSVMLDIENMFFTVCK